MSSSSSAGDWGRRNREAWNDLYRTGRDHIWGRGPAPYLDEWKKELGEQLAAAPRILDTAAGEGRNLEFLRGLSPQVFACDASRHALGRLEPAQRARSVVCDLAQMPFRCGSLGLVLMNDVVETLPDPAKVLREVLRVLRPGGILLCNIPSGDEEIAGMDMEPLPEGGFLYRGRYFYRFHERSDAARLLRRSGLEIVGSRMTCWDEGPHAGFREQSHRHRSTVFLARRPTSA